MGDVPRTVTGKRGGDPRNDQLIRPPPAHNDETGALLAEKDVR